MEIIDHYFYTKEHEWVNFEDNVATTGITDYAQDALGDITYIQLPEVELEVEQFEQFASVESVKAASDVFSPVSGRIIEVNTNLESHPELINKSCYERGWIAKIETNSQESRSNLLTAREYRKYLESLEA